MNYIHILMIICCLSGFLTGCGEKEPVLARIGRFEIRESEFIRQMAQSPAQYEGYLATSLGKQAYLDVLVNEKIIVQAAVQEKLNNDREIQQELKEMRRTYQQKLADIQEKMLIRKFLEHHRQLELKLTDVEIHAYYKAHIDEFKEPREIIISHILLDSEEAAQDVFKRLYAGESFDDLVKEVSLDAITRDNGGRLPALTRRSMIPEFKQVVFQLKDNEISGIIKSSFGYHIIKKRKEKKLPAVSEADARKEISNILEKEKFVKLIERYKKEFNVTVKYDYFSAQ